MRIAVIGGGPAGLLAAAEAGKNAAVTLFERNEKPGKKLYITGKGRCNVTNDCPIDVCLQHVVSNPKFLYGAFNVFPPARTAELFQSLQVPLKTERGGRMFPCSDKASDITGALVRHCNKSGVRFAFCSDVTAIVPEHNGFRVKATNAGKRDTPTTGELFDRVILAAGGCSYPSTGSDGGGYALAKSLGHTVVPVYPALVPLKFTEPPLPLQGLSLKNVRVTIEGEATPSMFGEMLFTHTGASGPAVLSLSSYVKGTDLRGKTLCIDLKPALSENTLHERIIREFAQTPNQQVRSVLRRLMPEALIPFVMAQSGVENEQANAVTKELRARLVFALQGVRFPLSEKSGFHEAIVTGGGVSIGEVNPKTMESKRIKGLYFAGEILDVDALTGGFNIQLCLSTGFVAGSSAGRTAI